MKDANIRSHNATMELQEEIETVGQYRMPVLDRSIMKNGPYTAASIKS